MAYHGVPWDRPWPARADANIDHKAVSALQRKWEGQSLSPAVASVGAFSARILFSRDAAARAAAAR